jgi:general secretion pathway protein L
MARVLGLDLGSHSIKAVVIETTMRGSAVKGHTTILLPEDPAQNLASPVQASDAQRSHIADRNSKLKAVLPKLIEQGLIADASAIAFPGTGLATHAVSLPFTDAKKIESTLAFEVESQLPYDLDLATYDSHLAFQDDKGTQLLVGVVKKKELAELLENLNEVKVDPKVITHSGLAYQSLFSILPESDGCAAIVDIGHERVSMAIGLPNGTVEWARTFGGGGHSLTRALATEFAIPYADAASWKETHGAVGEEAIGADAQRASGAFITALQPVTRELRTTLKSFSARTKKNVTRIYLCGGTAKLRGINAQLERDLGVSVSSLELPADTRDALGVGALEFAQASALSLRAGAGSIKNQKFNLRKGEFSFKSDMDFVKERLPQLAGFGVILLALLIASGIIRNAVLEKREKQIDAMMCDVTQRILGSCEKDPQRAVALLKGQSSPAAGIPKRSAATLLAELTTRVPNDMNITMDQIVIDMDRIAVRCEAASSKNMEDLITELKKYKCFKEINEGKLEKSKDGTKVNFRLDIQVSCPEDAESGAQG